MSIGIDLVKQNGKITLRLSGAFTMHNVYQVRHCVDKLLERGIRDLTLDFSQIYKLDSAGIGALLKIHRQMTDLKGRLILIGCNESIIEVLRTTQLDRLLKIGSPLKTKETDEIKILKS